MSIITLHVQRKQGKAICVGVHICIQCILTYPNPSVQAKNIFVRITEKFRYVKYIEKYITVFYYNMNIIKMHINNVIILILAVRICEDSDTRGSDKRG